MFSIPFTTPVCSLFGSRLDSPVPNTAFYAIKVVFDRACAATMRAETRAFLWQAFGRVSGARAEVPLVELSGERWLLDLYSRAVPIICDKSGEPCIVARLPVGSMVRITGSYHSMVSPRLVPVMTAIQIVTLAPVVATRLFDAVA